jgi:hypothetical protein
VDGSGRSGPFLEKEIDSMFVSYRSWIVGLALIAAASGARTAGAASLIVDGDFSASVNSGALRKDAKGPDWYESRRDAPGSRKLLMLSKKAVAGNTSPKAMIKAHPDLNTYLSQPFSAAQTGDLRVQFDILVKEILADDNRSAFVMVGGSSDKKGGPNSTGAERFVFLGFQNSAAQPGKIELFAREGNRPWENRTVLAKGLDRDRWYTVELTIYAAEAVYEVSVKGVTAQPLEVEAFRAGKSAPRKLTHLSFASWNDGAGTFYVDNVSAQTE